MKQKTLQFALEWSSRTQEFQVARQLIPSMGCGNRESPVTNLPIRSWYDQVSYSMKAATTVKECQRRASTGWQCNRERVRQTSCAQAGTACTVFSLWSATSATPAKQEWHGPEQYVLLHARFSVVRQTTRFSLQKTDYHRLWKAIMSYYSLHLENYYTVFQKKYAPSCFLMNQLVKEFGKSVNIWQSYYQTLSGLLFWDTVYNQVNIMCVVCVCMCLIEVDCCCLWQTALAGIQNGF